MHIKYKGRKYLVISTNSFLLMVFDFLQLLTNFRVISSGVLTGLDGSDGECDFKSCPNSPQLFFWNCCDNFRPTPATNPATIKIYK